MVFENAVDDDMGLVGRVIAGGLQVRERTGTSPQGPLYEAVDPEGRPVVLLVVPARVAGQDDRILRSLRWATQIRHPSVAAVYALGDLPGGATWVALEKLAGEPLADVLSARSPLPIGEAVDLAIQIASGLEASHRVGLIHGNVSPATIVVTRAPYGKPRVKIVGFSVGSDEMGGPALDPAGAAYASPERLAGVLPGAQDDVFSVGAVLYHLLTGAPPTQASSAGKVPRAARAVLEKALVREPAARFRTMAELRVALEALAVVSATPVETVEYRKILSRAIAAGLVLVIGGALAVSVWRRVDTGGGWTLARALSSEPVAVAPAGSRTDTMPATTPRERPPSPNRGTQRTPQRSIEPEKVSGKRAVPGTAAAETSPERPAENRRASPDPPGYVGQTGGAGVTSHAPEPTPAATRPPRSRGELDENQGLRLAIGDVTRVGLAEDVVERRVGLLVVQLTAEGMGVPSATYNLQRLYLAYSAASDHPDSVALELRQNGAVLGWFTREGLRYARSGEGPGRAPRAP